MRLRRAEKNVYSHNLVYKSYSISKMDDTDNSTDNPVQIYANFTPVQEIVQFVVIRSKTKIFFLIIILGLVIN